MVVQNRTTSPVLGSGKALNLRTTLNLAKPNFFFDRRVEKKGGMYRKTSKLPPKEKPTGATQK
jgi:hypothetical protein